MRFTVCYSTYSTRAVERQVRQTQLVFPSISEYLWDCDKKLGISLISSITTSEKVKGGGRFPEIGSWPPLKSAHFAANPSAEITWWYDSTKSGCADSRTFYETVGILHWTNVRVTRIFKKSFPKAKKYLFTFTYSSTHLHIIQYLYYMLKWYYSTVRCEK